MKDNQLKAWESTRTKGKLKFVVITGVLSWGLPMLIVMAFMHKPFVDGFISKAAIIHYVVWPLAGVVVGLLTWYLSERQYKKELGHRSKK